LVNDLCAHFSCAFLISKKYQRIANNKNAIKIQIVNSVFDNSIGFIKMYIISLVPFLVLL